MKKYILTVLITLTMCAGVNAQGRNDAFINDWAGSRSDDAISSGLMGVLPAWGVFGQGENTDAPVGGGLLILTALGAGYALKHKVDNQKQ